MKLVRTLGAFCVFGLAPTALLAQSGDRSAAPPTYAFTAPGQTAVETALDGYCPVCVVMDKGWVPGDPNISTTIDGQRYLFPSQDVKAVFDADPAKFIPAAGGDCVVCQVEKGERVAGSVQHAATYEGRVYLFPNDPIRQAFVANPAKYATADLAYDGDCAVCQIEHNKRVPGNAAHTAVFDGKRYQFPSDQERRAFLANPARYAERHGG